MRICSVTLQRKCTLQLEHNFSTYCNWLFLNVEYRIQKASRLIFLGSSLTATTRDIYSPAPVWEYLHIFIYLPFWHVQLLNVCDMHTSIWKAFYFDSSHTVELLALTTHLCIEICDCKKLGVFCSIAQQSPVGQGFLIIEVSLSHLDTWHTVGLLWTSDQLDAETSTWQHTTLTTERHTCLRREWNPQSQQASDRRPTS
jgi:hypothetical protein